MSYRSFQEWNARGRQIIKGEQCMGRLNDGTPLFGKEQTKKVEKKPKPRSSYACQENAPSPGRSTRQYAHSSYSRGTNWDQGMDLDECMEYGLDIGIPNH